MININISLFTNSIDHGGASTFFLRMNDAFQNTSISSNLIYFNTQKSINPSVETINLLEKSIFQRILYLRKELIRNKSTVVITNYGLETLICKAAASLIKKRIGIISVVHIRPVLWIPNEMAFYKKIVFKSLIKLSFLVTDKVITVSDDLKKEISESKWVNKKKIETAYNPVIKDNFTVGPREISSDLINIGIIGWIWDIKNQLEAVKAIQKINRTNITLKIIGGVKDEQYYQLLKDFINENKMDKQVIFCGIKEDIFEEFKQLDLLLLCSRTEALPTVIIESLACGVPVIATNCKVGPSEILNNGEYGILYDGGNVKMLTEAIITLIDNKEIYNHYSIQGIRRSQKFTYSSAVDRYERVIKTLK